MKLSKIIAVFLLLAGVSAVAEERTYHKIKPSECATTKWTHVEMTGKVALVKKEGDGDIHIRVEDEKGFCVAEIIPSMPLPKPKVGQSIAVRGISRMDKTHGWGEVHPVESIHPVAAS